MAKFESKNGELYIDGEKVLKAWESFSGWYWFATEEVSKQDSDLGDGKVFKDDTIYFGYVQGLEEEWGNFAQSDFDGQIKRGRVWEIPKKDLASAGRRGNN